MQKYSKPKFRYDDLGKNPCTISLVIPVNILTIKHQYEKDKDDDMLVNVQLELEYTEYCKVYASSERRKLVSSLSPCAKELYLWLLYEIKYGQDALWINKERFMEENTTSLNTYKKAIEELIRYAFIAYTVVKDVYWINPDFFFKGDRLKKYPNNKILIK